jgi:hypothetical protein
MAIYEFVSVHGSSYSILCIDFEQIEQNYRKQEKGLEAKARKYNGNDGSLTKNFQVKNGKRPATNESYLHLLFEDFLPSTELFGLKDRPAVHYW